MIASAVILAAGRGDRMQAMGNKIFTSIAGAPLICRTVRSFLQVSEIEELVLVANASELEQVARLVSPIAPHVRMVAGGPTRRDSALAGVRAARGSLVLIHDGARPFPTKQLIRNVLAEAKQSRAAIPVLRSTDLLHHLLEGSRMIRSLPSRNESLARAQTPQGFERTHILRCLENASPDVRDDASAVLLAGFPISTVDGEPTNVKITRPEDLPLAEAIASFLEP